MPGPHGFAVRNSIARLARRSIAHEVHLALRRPARAMLPRPPHPAPTLVTMADAPLRAGTAGVLALICPTTKAEYFCGMGWTHFTDLPDGLICRTLRMKTVIAAR